MKTLINEYTGEVYLQKNINYWDIREFLTKNLPVNHTAVVQTKTGIETRKYFWSGGEVVYKAITNH